MKTNFDEYVDFLLESLLTEAPISTDSPAETTSIVDEIVDKIMSSKGTSGHWVKAFSSKKIKENESREMVSSLVWDVIKIILPEKEHTYNPDITKADLKPALHNAIKSVFEINSTYSSFLSDRFANKELLGRVKDVINTGLSDDLESEIEITDDGAVLKTSGTEDENEFENKEDQEAEDEMEELNSVPNKSNTPPAEYDPEMEYRFNTLSDLKSGVLTHDLRIKFEKLDSLHGEYFKGKQFAKLFHNYGFSLNDVKEFINAGILEPADETINPGDTEGFEKTTQDFMDDYVKGPLADYRSSSSGERFGR